METLHIRLLGDLNVAYGKTPVRIKSARLQSLFAFLLLHRAVPQPRQQIAFAFWPDQSEIKSRNNLRQLIFDLRRALPDADDFVEIADTTLQWRQGAPFTLDVLDFERACAAAEGQPSDEWRASLERAVSIYQGDLLMTCYDDWILPERERLRQDFVRVLEELVVLLEQQHEYRLALGQAQRLLRYDPLREETYRDLMRLASRCGDRTGVVRHYRACVNMLRQELEVEPSPETRRVYEQSLSHIATLPSSQSATARATLGIETNLPSPANRFVGRVRELEQVKQMLAEHRLVTLCGAAGVGKTRLALAVAPELNLPQGAWFVGLGVITDPVEITRAIAAALGIREMGGQPIQDTLAEYLRDKRLLLLLDNCEHLASEVRVLAERLLRDAPGLRILTTSRKVLDIPGEAVYRVPPLDVPEIATPKSANRSSARDRLIEISQCDSVQLFSDRASAILPTFELSAENAPYVADICRQLDGLPLAIELAAARMNVLSAAQIDQRLSAALSLLSRGSPVALPHQQTVQATLDWSYDLLSTSERVLFRRLAVFAGSFDLPAIEAICDIPPATVLDLLSNLIDKSLVEPIPAGSWMRYHLLEVVRQYAWDKLRDSREQQSIRQKHCDYYARWAERAEPELRGARQVETFALFEREHANLRAALEWCQQSPESAEPGMCLASTLWWFWFAGGHLSEGRALLRELLASSNAASKTIARARALDTAGFLALFHGDFTPARQHAETALALAQELGDKREMALALFVLGDADVVGDPLRAIANREMSLALSEEIDDKWMMAFTLNSLGEMARLRDDYPAAQWFYESSLQIRQEIQDRRGIAVCLSNLAVVAYHQGDAMLADRLFRQVLTIRQELKDVVGVASSLVGMIGATIEQGRADSIRCAAKWLASIDAGLDTLRIPLIGPDLREFQAVSARVRAHLSEPAVRRAWEEGRQMTVDQAVTDVLENNPPDQLA